MYKKLVICGGGARCITLLGAIGKIDLKEIEEVSGCSAGAYIAVLFLLGVKPIEGLELLPTNMDIRLDIERLILLSSRKGIFRIKKFTKLFRTKVRNILGIRDPTLQDLYNKTGKTLYIQVTDIDNRCAVYLNHKDHPNVDLFKAIHASSSIPVIFTPVTINGARCVDGGVVTNMPLEPFFPKRGTSENFKETEDTIILDCVGKSDDEDKGGLFSFISDLLRVPSSIKKKSDLERFRGRYVKIPSKLGLLEFSDNDKNIEEFLVGWNHPL